MFRTLILGALVLAFGAAPALAADAVATWSPAAVYVAIQPYVLVAFGVVFSAGFGWLLMLLQRHTGIVVSQNARDAIQTAAMNAAGRIMASLDPKVATMAIDVKSPEIAAELPHVLDAIGNTLVKVGVTPDAMAAMIAGKLGQLQSQAMSAPVAAPVAEPAK